MPSTLSIDGFQFHGSAADILAMFNATNHAADNLSRDGLEYTWVPVTATNSDGYRVVQIVRLTRSSTMNLTIVDDGTMVDEFYDSIVETHKQFMQRPQHAAKD